MKRQGRIIIPIIIICLITALGCYYILKEYNKQLNKNDFEIKKGIASEKPEDESTLVSDEDIKRESVVILVQKNQDENKLAFNSLDSTKRIELMYDGSTEVLGKHGNSLSIDQLKLGEILNVTYSLHSGVIDILQISDETWTQTDVTRFEIDSMSGTMRIGKNLFKLEESVVVSYGDVLANLIDVTNVDTLTVKGDAGKVCSIIVEKGHGYLRLANDAYFVGGWVEVGQEIIKPISEEMLIPVPEGNYKLRVTNRGYEGTDSIKIDRDRETIADLNRIDIKEVSIGHVRFNIKPDYAQLFVDNEIMDYEDPVPLEYGVHSVHVELVGYSSIDTNIKVTSKNAEVNIELERSNDESSSSGTGSSSEYGFTSSTYPYASSSVMNSSTVTVRSSSYNPFAPGVSSSSSMYNPFSSSTYYAVSSSSSSDSSSSSMKLPPFGESTSSFSFLPYPSSSTSSSESSSSSMSTSSSTSSSSSSSSSSSTPVISENRKLYIEAPAGVEAYVDGAYVGVVPVSCLKPDRSQVIITLYKSGYVPRSYTVNIPSNDEDVTYSFSELEKEGGGSSSSSSSSTQSSSESSSSESSSSTETNPDPDISESSSSSFEEPGSSSGNAEHEEPEI